MAASIDLSQQVQINDENRSKHVEKLITILREYHKSLGIYSSKVEDHLSLLKHGSIVVGQQPVIFGGPGFIGNKFAALIFLHLLAEEKGVKMAPIFFLGDYDGIQKELARQYYPNPISSNAVSVDAEEYLPLDSNIASHSAELPPQQWLFETLQRLDDNLRGFKKKVKGPARKTLESRWDHIQTLLKMSFNNSSTLSDWAASIWGNIVNIINDYGIILLPTSHPEVRKLVAPEYLKFIINREKYAAEFEQSMHKLREMGYEPTLPDRHSTYSPFMLECAEDNSRIATQLVEKEGNVWVDCQCPSCKRKYAFRVDSEEFLLEHATQFGPRVDSSQALFQNLLGIKIRISGPGEIAYYAQTAPALRKIGFTTPIFIRYKRAYYNTSWNELLGKQLDSRSQPSLLTQEMFDIMRERHTGIKEDNVDILRTAENKMKSYILDTYHNLEKLENNNDVSTYLGWQFGKFHEYKFGQEVSWMWIDLALQTGLTDYIPTYLRMYHKNSPPSGIYFLNTSI